MNFLTEQRNNKLCVIQFWRFWIFNRPPCLDFVFPRSIKFIDSAWWRRLVMALKQRGKASYGFSLKSASCKRSHTRYTPFGCQRLRRRVNFGAYFSVDAFLFLGFCRVTACEYLKLKKLKLFLTVQWFCWCGK